MKLIIPRYMGSALRCAAALYSAIESRSPTDIIKRIKARYILNYILLLLLVNTEIFIFIRTSLL